MSLTLGCKTVIDVLIDNRVPSEWVDHSYPFGLAYLEAHHSGNPLHQAMLDEINNERLAQLQRYGIPIRGTHVTLRKRVDQSWV